jgi:hypothetical protein
MEGGSVSANPLRLVNAETGEVVEADRRVADLEDQVAGLLLTVKAQSRKMGSLERELLKYDPKETAQPDELAALIERWKWKTGHHKSKASKDRFDLIRARLKDGYTLQELELAIDGLGAYPYRVYDKRFPRGRDADRHDQLSDALGSSERVEKLAKLGYYARKEQG